MNVKEGNKIAFSGFISYLTIVITIITGMIYTPILVKTIGQSNYGLFSLATTFVSFFLMDFGISTAVSRFVSIYVTKKEYDKVNGFLGIVTKLFLTLDIIVFVVLFISFFLISDIFKQLTIIEIEKLKIIYLIVSSYSILSFPFLPLNGILIAYEEFVPMKQIDLFQKIITFVLLMSLLYLFPNLYVIVFINSFVNFISIFLKLRVIRSKLNIKVNLKYHDNSILRSILSFSVWSTIILISQRLILNISPTVLGIFSGAKEIALFSVGSSIEGYFFLFANALNSLFLPTVSRIIYGNKSDENKKKKSLLESMILIGRIQLILSGCIFILFIVGGSEFLNLWLGNDYEMVYYIVLFLILPGLVTYTQIIAYNYLSIINEIRYRAYSYLGSAIISLILSVLLASRYGAVGVAFACFVGIFIGQVVLLNLFLYIKLKIDIISFFYNTHIKLLPSLLLSFLMIKYLNIIIGDSSFLLFLIKNIIFVLIYFVIVFFIGLNDKEKNAIKSKLRG